MYDTEIKSDSFYLRRIFKRKLALGTHEETVEEILRVLFEECKEEFTENDDSSIFDFLVNRLSAISPRSVGESTVSKGKVNAV